MEFQFALPTAVTFGPGVSKRAGDVLAGFGAKRVFLIEDAGVKQSGISTAIVNSIKDKGIDVVEYDGVQPNPKDNEVEKTAALAKAAGVDAVIAVGGGSPIDTAKAVNILLSNPAPVTQYAGIGLVKNPVLPLIAIPTTAGTASEVTAITVITDTSTLTKLIIGGPNCGAAVALVDPELTISLPQSLTASTGMDALTHAIEAYTVKTASPATDVNAIKAVELIYHNLEKAYTDGSNIEARENMLLGSMLAGFAFTNSLLGLVHSIAHVIGAHYDIPHGIANAIGLPYVIEYNRPAITGKLKDVAVAMGLDVEGLFDDDASKKVVQALHELSAKLNIPRLRETAAKEDEFDIVAEAVLKELSTTVNPKEPSADDVMALLKEMW